jgi:hypothetical protein
MALPVEVRVYDEDNTTLIASLTHSVTPANNRQVREVSGKQQLDDSGDGKLVVDYDHPQVGALTAGRWVQVIENSRIPFSFRIDNIREVLVPGPGGGDKAKVVEVSGDGTLNILKLGRVLPWMMCGCRRRLRPLSRPSARFGVIWRWSRARLSKPMGWPRIDMRSPCVKHWRRGSRRGHVSKNRRKLCKEPRISRGSGPPIPSSPIW